MGRQFRCRVDGRGAVRPADDADGAGFGEIEAQEDTPEQRGENAELRRSTEEQCLGICEQRAEVRQRPDAHEDQGRKHARLHPEIEIVDETAFIENAGFREVREQHAEPDGHQEQGFEALMDGQIEEEAGDGEHEDVAEMK